MLPSGEADYFRYCNRYIVSISSFLFLSFVVTELKMSQCYNSASRCLKRFYFITQRINRLALKQIIPPPLCIIKSVRVQNLRLIIKRAVIATIVEIHSHIATASSVRAHEPNTQSFSALCALAIAYISSRFARISSSMHIANQSIKNHVQGIAFLETRRIIALQVSESNRKEIMELRAFTAASRTDRTRTTHGTDDFKPIGKGLRFYENICQYAKTSAKLNSQSRALRIRQMVVQCNAMCLPHANSKVR